MRGGAMNYLDNERGMLMEIPLLLFAYGMLCAFLMPKDMSGSPLFYLLVAAGGAVSCLLSMSISLDRSKVLGLPLCLVLFIGFSVLTIPCILWVGERVLAGFLLTGQALASFLIELKICDIRDQRRRPRGND